MSGRSISFTIPGRIGGKLRHRSFIRDGHIETMTPKKTVNEEAIVRHFASQAMRGQPLLTGALRLEITLNKLMPESWSKKKRAAAFWITGKPDASNQLKLLEDGMNRTVFADDSQIADIHMRRMYGLPEAITVTVTELEAP